MSDRAVSFNLRTVGSMPRPARLLFAILSRLRYGRLEIVAPGGQSFSFPGALPGPDASLKLDDWDVCAEILRCGRHRLRRDLPVRSLGHARPHRRAVTRGAEQRLRWKKRSTASSSASCSTACAICCV